LCTSIIYTLPVPIQQPGHQDIPTNKLHNYKLR
jgi:hypothetical protein